MNREFCPSCSKQQCVRSGAERAGATCGAGRSQGTEQQGHMKRQGGTPRLPPQRCVTQSVACDMNQQSKLEQRSYAHCRPPGHRATTPHGSALGAAGAATVTLRAPDYRERNEARDLKQQSKQELGSCATPRSRPSIERSSRTEHAGVSESPNPGLAQQHAVPGRCTRHSHSVINDSSYCNALRCAPTRCALVRCAPTRCALT